jgi:hypothetical protein
LEKKQAEKRVKRLGGMRRVKRLGGMRRVKRE